MPPSVPQGFSLIIGAVLVVLSVFSNAPLLRAFTPSPPVPKRWAQFELWNSSAEGIVALGKVVELAVTLGGVASTKDPLVAAFESTMFHPRVIPLTEDSIPMVWRGAASLEPRQASRTSVQQKAVRIQVTFARDRGGKLERLLTRVVYVTVGPPLAPRKDGQESDAPILVENYQADGMNEVQPDVAPVAAVPVAEEDLMPLPSPGEGRPYWQHISHVISKSWSRHVRQVRRGPSGEIVKVRFKMYPSGVAQLIHIEKGSGSREIDVAGIQAIVHAQPFPPFPSELGNEAVDVHIRMRTGVKAGGRDVQTVAGGATDKERANSSQPSR
jgi:TonB family protein